MNDQPLNAAQMAAVQKAVGAFLENVNLRKWCVEQAVELASQTAEHYKDGSINMAMPDPVKLAERVYAFITAGADR